MSAPLPLVSVCIPTYNRADKLARAVASIRSGTYPHLEIVISDNGSTDHTARIGESLAAADPRIVYYRHDENHGPTHNFNFAKSLAKGKYFLWHGDDDYIDPDYIERCVARLEADERLVLVAGAPRYSHADGTTTLGDARSFKSPSPLLRMIRYAWTVRDNSIFYGVYRASHTQDLSLRNVLGNDWFWITTILYRGRAEVLIDTHTNRDHGDTTGVSMIRICQVFKQPLYHARLSWIFLPYHVARFTDLVDAQGRPGSILYSAMARPLIGAAILGKLMREFGQWVTTVLVRVINTGTPYSGSRSGADS